MSLDNSLCLLDFRAISLSSGFHLPPATKSPARDTGIGHRCSWHPDDVDEQRTSSPVGWRSAFKNARVVGEIIAGELWVAQLHHKVRYVIATKNRKCGIRIILKEAVFSLAPKRNEVAGLHMSRQTRGAISEADRHGIHSAQDELSVAEAHIFRVLHKKNIHIFFRLLAGRGPRNYRARAGSRCRGCGTGHE